jgi:hypothetical protein
MGNSQPCVGSEAPPQNKEKMRSCTLRVCGRFTQVVCKRNLSRGDRKSCALNEYRGAEHTLETTHDG